MTSSTPTSAATARAVRSLSPVSNTGVSPSSRSCAIASALVGLIVFIAHDPVRSERIYAWLHPEETKLEKGMQAWQSMAVSSRAEI